MAEEGAPAPPLMVLVDLREEPGLLIWDGRRGTGATTRPPRGSQGRPGPTPFSLLLQRLPRMFWGKQEACGVSGSGGTPPREPAPGVGRVAVASAPAIGPVLAGEEGVAMGLWGDPLSLGGAHRRNQNGVF